MRRLLLSIVALVAVACVTQGQVRIRTVPTVSAGLLDSTTFGASSYLGSFKVDQSDSFGSTNGWAFGATNCAYDPEGNGGAGSLFASNYDRMVAEISIPTLVKGDDPTNGLSSNSASLNTATMLQNFYDITHGHVYDSAPFVGGYGYYFGLLVYNHLLYGDVVSFYDGGGPTTTRTSHFWHSRTLSTTPSDFGFYSFNPASLSRAFSGSMAPIPSAWQATLGGKAITGDFGLSVISTGLPYGPAAFAFDPADITGTGSPDANVASSPLLTNVPLVYYPSDHQTLGPWAGNNDLFGINSADSGKLVWGNSLLIFGKNGKGHAINPLTGLDESTAYYGNGVSDWALNGTPDGVFPDNYNAYDPVNAGSHGQHGWPYYYEVWGYRLSDLADVKAGIKQSWEIVPYGTWELPLPWNRAGAATRVSATVDTANKKVYFCQMQAMTFAAPIISVYSLP